MNEVKNMWLGLAVLCSEENPVKVKQNSKFSLSKIEVRIHITVDLLVHLVRWRRTKNKGKI